MSATSAGMTPGRSNGEQQTVEVLGKASALDLMAGAPPSGSQEIRGPVDDFGRELSPDRAMTRVRVFNQRIIDRFGGITRDYTPEIVAEILAAAAEGSFHDFADFASEMEERDAVISHVAQVRKLALLGVPYEVVENIPHDASSAEADLAVEIGAACRALIERIYGWRDSLFDLLDAIMKGISVCEIDWLPGGDIAQLRWIHPRRYTLDHQSNRLLILPDSGFGRGVEAPPHKLVVHRPRVRSGNVFRDGMARVHAFPYIFRKYGIKDNVIYNEVFAMPIRLGILKAGWGDRDVKLLEQALEKLASDSSAVTSEAAEIKFESAVNRHLTPYGPFLDMLAGEIETAHLGQERQRDATTVGQFDYSDAVRQDILEFDGESLGSTIRNQVFYPWVLFNYGPDAARRLLPYHVFQCDPPSDLVALAEVAKALFLPRSKGGLGVAVRADYVYDAFSVPKPDEDDPDEELLVPRAELSAAADPVVDDPAEEEEDDDPPASKAAEKRARALLTKRLLGRYVTKDGTNPEQAAVDDLTDRAHTKARRAISDIVDAALAIAAEAESFEEIPALVKKQFPSMPVKRLEELVGHATFVSRLYGMQTVADVAAAKRKAAKKKASAASSRKLALRVSRSSRSMKRLTSSRTKFR